MFYIYGIFYLHLSFAIKVSVQTVANFGSKSQQGSTYFKLLIPFKVAKVHFRFVSKQH